MVSSFCTSIQIVFFYGVCVLLVEVVLLCWNWKPIQHSIVGYFFTSHLSQFCTMKWENPTNVLVVFSWGSIKARMLVVNSCWNHIFWFKLFVSFVCHVLDLLSFVRFVVIFMALISLFGYVLQVISCNFVLILVMFWSRMLEPNFFVLKVNHVMIWSWINPWILRLGMVELWS
jgi:hypothetical protein